MNRRELEARIAENVRAASRLANPTYATRESEMEKQKMSFAQAMLAFFGKNGKDTSAFMAEMKALTPEDKAEFREQLKEFYDIT